MPSTSPVTLDELRAHIGFDAEDDALVDQYNAAAVSWVEGYTGLLLSSQEVTEEYGRLASPTPLRHWPITTVGAFKYYDADGIEQTIAAPSYRLARGSRPARVSIMGAVPYAPVGPAAAMITYTAGYASPEDVPAAVKQAIFVLVAEFYQNREAGNISTTASRAVAGLLRSFRRRTL